MNCSLSFTDTIRNEKEVEDRICQENGCISLLNHSLPLNAYKSTCFIEKHFVIVKFGLFLLDHILFWTLRLFFLKKTLAYISEKILSGTQTEVISGQIILYYCALLPRTILHSPIKNEVSRCTVLTPSGAMPSFSGAGRQISITQAASFADFFRAYACACREIANTRKKYGAKATYHVLKSYDIHLTRLVLEKNSKITRLIYANIYDRWACMFSHMNGVEKVMLQHGLLGDKVLTLPQKVGSVDVLFCYNDSFVVYFQHLLDNIGTINYLENTFSTAPCQKRTGTISVLLIANPVVDFQAEQKIISLLLQSPDKFDVYLKPHPRYPFAPYRDLKKHYDFHLIEDPDYFPAVDVAISYESTLAWEYQLTNTPVLYYDQMSAEIILKELNGLYEKD